MRTSVKYRVIYRHREKYTISEICRFFEVSRSGYYDFVKRMGILAKDLPLAEKIRECLEECGKIYGYRRVHLWLGRKNIHCNPKTVLCVMQIVKHWENNVLVSKYSYEDITTTSGSSHPSGSKYSVYTDYSNYGTEFDNVISISN